MAVIDTQGYCIGSMGKDLSLDFVNTLLSNLVSKNPLLSAGGRVFVFEQSGQYLVGASTGNIYNQQDCPTCSFGFQVCIIFHEGSYLSASGQYLKSH